MATVQAPKLLSAEEFRDRPDPGHPEELVLGRVIKMPPTRAISFWVWRLGVARPESSKGVRDQSGPDMPMLGVPPEAQPPHGKERRSNSRHGKVCNVAGRVFGNFVEDHDLGHVLNNDAGFITTRDPDTVRGPDVAFYSYARLPKGPVPDNYSTQPPELVVEVRSPSDRWRAVLEKITEYLHAGVSLVLVLDPEPAMAHAFSADDPPRMLGPDEELTLPGILEGFRVRVGRFFE